MDDAIVICKLTIYLIVLCEPEIFLFSVWNVAYFCALICWYFALHPLHHSSFHLFDFTASPLSSALTCTSTIDTSSSCDSKSLSRGSAGGGPMLSFTHAILNWVV